MAAKNYISNWHVSFKLEWKQQKWRITHKSQASMNELQGFQKIMYMQRDSAFLNSSTVLQIFFVI